MAIVEQSATPQNGTGEVLTPEYDPKTPPPPKGWRHMEIVKVGEMEACLHAELTDDGERPVRVINVANGARIEATVDLIGDLWRCTCGSIRFTADFSGGGDAQDFVVRKTATFDGAQSQTVTVWLDVDQDQFGIDDDVADYRVSVNALILDTTGKPLAMAGGIDLGYVAAYDAYERS